jgi:hypothetical protein
MPQRPAPSDHAPHAIDAIANPRHYKYYDLVMAAFVTVLLCSNLIGPGKTCILPLPFEVPRVGRSLTFGAEISFSHQLYLRRRD